MEQQLEVKKPESDKSVTTVTNDQLDSAWQDVIGTEETQKVDQVVEQPKPVEEVMVEQSPIEKPIDQAESSRLGRKVKGLEDQLQNLMSKMDTYFAPKEGLAPQQDVELPEIIQTPDDVRRVMQAEEQRKQNFVNQYRSGYARKILDLGNGEDIDKETHDAIVEEMMIPNSPFNNILSDNPLADAEINYAKAMRAVLSKKYSKPKEPIIPGRAETPVGALGVTVGTKTAQPTINSVQLDEASQDFVKKLGLNEEFVKKALSREAPIGIKR